jgi:hypothetical protein
MATFRGTPEEIKNLKVGDTLFNFDGNRRVYASSNGYGGGPPIYEKHFKAVTIESETTKSWVMSPSGAKVNKKTLESSMHYADRGYFTKSAMEADIWSNEHRHKITREVGNASVDHLKEIARIIGYRVTPPPTRSGR